MRSRLEIYCDILNCGLLHIRNHTDDHTRSFIEADHLHNIPDILRNIENEELHQFYWDVTRPSFIQQSKSGWLDRFEELWQELDNANRCVRRS